MAGTLVVALIKHGSVKKTTFTWTSDASGDVSGGAKPEISGEILRVVTNPDGTDAPTDNYDIVLNDDDSVDIAQGLLANRDTANTEEIIVKKEIAVGATTELAAVFHHGLVDCVIANAGDAKKGVVNVYWR
jgi:hypothetical protein